MSQFVTDRSYDYFDLGDESDQESAESSEDEIDIILHGTPEQRRRLRHCHAKEQRQKGRQQPGQSKTQQRADKQQSSSEDEFEKEMNKELDKTVSMLEKSRGTKAVSEPSVNPSIGFHTDAATHPGSTSVEKKKSPFYSDIYFDSDDEENYEGEGDARVQKHHAKLSNDDLLYDPDMDEEDQRWVDQQRWQQRSGTKRASGTQRNDGKKPAVPKSDAVLDCPACMTTLCLDCQRHDVYPNQFRAMFVMNCRVNHSETLSVPEQAAKKKFKKSKKKSQGQSAESDHGGSQAEDGTSTSRDQFHPVLCAECDTVVGVMDLDEVYHFFNVLVSQP